MVEEIDPSEDGNNSEELHALQQADQIYNARGDVNFFISQNREATEDDLQARLGQARVLLESKKNELYLATKQSGWNSKDARSQIEDCALYRDQVVAVKQLFAMRGISLPSHRLDAESLAQAIQRFQQIEDNAKRLEMERLELERQAAADRAKQGDCFIATAVYGGRNTVELHTLRSFRDNFLLKSRPGRMCVSLYYRWSPPVADYLARNELPRRIVRIMLDRIVRLLKGHN